MKHIFCQTSRKHCKVWLISFLKKIFVEFLTRILHRAGAGMGSRGWKYKNVGCYSDSSAVSAAEGGGGGGEGGEKSPPDEREQRKSRKT